MITPNLVDDCWNRIGVRGDSSCPELTELIHCRNCPVFMRSATRLLDRPIPDEYLLEQTALAAEPSPVVEHGATNVLVFRLEDEWLALPARVCQEVCIRLPVHTIPFRRDGYILGLVNVRGELVITVSLDHLLGVCHSDKPANTADQRLVIIQKNNERFAFPVLETSGVRNVAPSAIRPVPVTLSITDAHYVTGMFHDEAGNVGILDDELLFFALGKGLT